MMQQRVEVAGRIMVNCKESIKEGETGRKGEMNVGDEMGRTGGKETEEGGLGRGEEDLKIGKRELDGQ